MSPTAASMSSDLYGMAILNACEIISERLRPIKEKMPDKRWNDWIFQAWFDRICLFSSGFYASPGLNYDHVKNEGRWFNYSTYGVGASVIEIDCLTGDHSVLRTDIVMDLGESLNPAIDIGQVEGAFTQGYGMFMMEQLIHSPEGNLLTRGPGAYKIPGFGDIPSEFNVSLLRGSSNPRAVFSSKAVGEPPLFLAASVYYAAKEAVRASRLHRLTSHTKLSHLILNYCIKNFKVPATKQLFLNLGYYTSKLSPIFESIFQQKHYQETLVQFGRNPFGILSSCEYCDAFKDDLLESRTPMSLTFPLLLLPKGSGMPFSKLSRNFSQIVNLGF
jgi:hypothetical protein